MNVVVIDDEEDICFILSFEMKTQGHEVLSFKSAADAKKFFNTQPEVDLVICDFQMPYMTGLEFFHWLRDQNYQCPFFILTGESTMDAHQLLNIGISEVFFKPQDLFKLRPALNKLSLGPKA